jgi:hypothetical protein
MVAAAVVLPAPARPNDEGEVVAGGGGKDGAPLLLREMGHAIESALDIAGIEAELLAGGELAGGIEEPRLVTQIVGRGVVAPARGGTANPSHSTLPAERFAHIYRSLFAIASSLRLNLRPVEELMMRSLEEEIEDLEKLDRQRVKSAAMRDEGRRALREVAESSWGKEAQTDDALLVKALCDRGKGPPERHVERLEKLVEGADDEGDIPVLRAARSMQALAAAPDSAFSESLLYFYYQIVREIYTADIPDWLVGGARAGVGGSASAFVTGECVRAILGFSRTLKNTAEFVDEVRSFLFRRRELAASGSPRQWCDIELRRRREDFRTNVVLLLDNIALRLGPSEIKKELIPDPDRLDEFIDQATQRTRQAVDNTVATFKRVIATVKAHRKAEKLQSRIDPSARTRLQRSQTGHVMALGALRHGHNQASEAQQLLHSTADEITALAALRDMFSRVSIEVKGLVHPSRSFLSTVLDRELAASSEARTLWDPAAMAFAAASYGFAADSFEDDRLRRAGLRLAVELSDRGRFPAGSPFHVAATQGYFEVSGASVLGALAQLLENVDAIPVDEDLAKRMLLFFDDTRRPIRGQPDHRGWCAEKAQEPAQAALGLTAASVLALDRINRMLDARINAQIFRHFSVKKELPIPRLRDLFYPDYGLRGEGSPWSGKEEPVGVVLEKMRRHVVGYSRRDKNVSAMFSLILFGPPGTGKTTLAESLARSSKVPLVEVTPSDIVSSGADVVERRARAVFKALALLTRVVILFDEFDPVLKRRDMNERQPTVFSFVTPGMLPKLKNLHDLAKTRGVAYMLVTNHIAILDGAAVRPGRFDCKLGIYAPDPLSRQGRLLDEAQRFFKELPERASPKDLEHRVREVVQKTGGGHMEMLCRPGYLLRPVPPTQAGPGSVFEYLQGDRQVPPSAVESPGPAPKLPKTKRLAPESAEAANLEYLQMAWISDWETPIKAAQDLTAFTAAIDNPPATPRSLKD